MAMGYSSNAAKRALIETKDNLEAAINYIMENMDKNLDAPLEEKGAQQADPLSVTQVCDMGFTEEQAQIALIKFVINC